MKRQESEHKKKKRIARDHKHGLKVIGVRRRPARINVRQSDFKVVARGVHRDEPDIERIVRATLDAYLRGELANL